MTEAPFDTCNTLRISEARESFLRVFLLDIREQQEIATALDAGCGFGFFSRCLLDLGLRVLAIDGRSGNVAEAKRRNPGVEFKVYDIEAPSIACLGRFDLVLCFGLLYHLENPFRAIRNLASITEKVLLLETVVIPGTSLAAFLYEEGQGQDQALNYIALIPTEAWFVKCLYRAGFPFVYKTRALPNHEEFRPTLLKRQRRTVLVASRVGLTVPLLYLVPEPKARRYMWYAFGTGSMLEVETVRNFLKSGRRLFRDFIGRRKRDIDR